MYSKDTISRKCLRGGCWKQEKECLPTQTAVPMEHLISPLFLTVKIVCVCFFLYFLCLFFFYFVCCVFWYDIWYPLVFYLLMQVVILFVTCVFCLDSIFPLIMSHFTYTYMYNVHCTYMYTFSISKSIFLYFYQIFPPIYTRGAACGTVLCNLSSHFPRLSFSRL